MMGYNQHLALVIRSYSCGLRQSEKTEFLYQMRIYKSRVHLLQRNTEWKISRYVFIEDCFTKNVVYLLYDGGGILCVGGVLVSEYGKNCLVSHKGCLVPQTHVDAAKAVVHVIHVVFWFNMQRLCPKWWHKRQTRTFSRILRSKNLSGAHVTNQAEMKLFIIWKSWFRVFHDLLDFCGPQVVWEHVIITFTPTNVICIVFYIICANSTWRHHSTFHNF